MAAETGDKIKPIRPEPTLWNHREGQIIPVPAGVADLVVVPPGSESRAIGQICQGAANWTCRRVTDRSEGLSSLQSLVRYGVEAELRSAFDRHSIR